MKTPALLEIRDLRVSFPTPRGTARAVRGVDLEVHDGEVHGLVGESGSGKTVTALSIMRLLPPDARLESGDVRFRGISVPGMDGERLREFRGAQAAMVFQDPARYFNPSLTVSEQIGEMLRLHLGLERNAERERVSALLETVGLEPTRRLLASYPHELSGGMRRRAMIAMAVSCDPSLLIADEPTTAVDVGLQVQLLGLLLRLQRELGMSVLFISHDLAVIRDAATWVSVLYCGRVMESGGAEQALDAPMHPYTRLLLASIPSPDMRGVPLEAIPGSVPDAVDVPGGCPFHPRCPLAIEICRREQPELEEKAGRLVACYRAGDS